MEVASSTRNVDVYSIIILICSIITLGFLFTWDFLVFSTTWTLRILILVYITLNILCFWRGFLKENDAASFRWNKPLKLSKKIKEYSKCLCVFAVSVVILYAVPVLLGAPFLSNCLETLQFSALLSTLITFPGILTWGGDELKWLRIVFGTGCQTHWESVWMRNSLFCLAGAWFGAFTIPLDWDRPWQIWPISCTYGSLFGYSIGLIYNLHHRQPFSATDRRKLV